VVRDPRAGGRPVTRVVRALSIAGSDPSGGAGIQADLKTFGALGAYGMAVITSLTAQNTCGVTAVHTPGADIVTAQLEALSADIAIDAVKVGMLAEAGVARAVAAWLREHRPPVVVLDPVMVATSGDRLLALDAVQVLRDELMPLADLVTPNLPELTMLTGGRGDGGWEDAVDAARRLAAETGVAVLVKGGHAHGDRCPDALIDPAAPGGPVEIDGPRITTRHTHGTGCSLSSALAALRPRCADWEEAARSAKAWLAGALRAADRLEVGHGNGPVDHFHALRHLAGDHVPFTTRMWSSTAPIRAAIDDLPFVRGLADGTLSHERFTTYLRQDARYLEGFARALARCSQLAPGQEEQRRWAAAAHATLADEAALHRDWLSAVPAAPESSGPSPTTTAYLDHLHSVAGRGEYGELVAAVLPCFWLYADVGARLHASAGDPAHPYRRWIDTYADEAFAELTAWVIAEADACAAVAGPASRDRMAAAFERSARYEWMFWDAAWRLEGWPI